MRAQTAPHGRRRSRPRAARSGRRDRPRRCGCSRRPAATSARSGRWCRAARPPARPRRRRDRRRRSSRSARRRAPRRRPPRSAGCGRPGSPAPSRRGGCGSRSRSGSPSCPTARRARLPCRRARLPWLRGGSRSGPRRRRRRPPRRAPSHRASQASGASRCRCAGRSVASGQGSGAPAARIGGGRRAPNRGAQKVTRARAARSSGRRDSRGRGPPCGRSGGSTSRGRHAPVRPPRLRLSSGARIRTFTSSWAASASSNARRTPGETPSSPTQTTGSSVWARARRKRFW